MTHLTTFQLDAVALAPGQHAEAEAHLVGCERCRGRSADMAEGRAIFLREVHPRTLAAVEQRANRFPAGALLHPAPRAGSGCRRFPHRQAVAERRPRRQGGPTFQVYAKRGAAVFPVASGARLQPGDQLRFAVAPGDFHQIIVGSVDGASQASIYYPFDGAHSAATAGPHRQEASHAASPLDGTLGEERLVALFSNDEIPAAEVLRSLREHTVPSGAVERTLIFEKAAP